MSPCTCCRSAACAMTVAARSVTCAPRWNMAYATRSSARASAPTFKTSGSAERRRRLPRRRLGPNLGVVLAKPRRITAIGGAVLGESDRHGNRLHDSDQRVLELDDHAARDHVLVRQRLVREVDRTGRNASLHQPLDPFRRRPGLQNLLDE